MTELSTVIGKTAAVIVTYRTNHERLAAILAQLSPQCGVVIADNTEDSELANSIAKCAAHYNAAYLGMGGNAGIARAQNRAIAHSWSAGAEHVLLLDDDSLPGERIVGLLHEGLHEASKLGPCIVGARTMSHGIDVSNARAEGRLTLCRDLMSSGTLISRAVFETVGEFDDSLFIDGVDFDWGWRASAAGIRAYLVEGATIEHRLGIGQVEIGPFSMRIPTPVRHYYQYRNMLRLMTRRHTPWGWRLSQAVRLPLKLVLLVFLAPEKSKRLRMASRGIRDAFIGRAGPMCG